MGDTLSSHPRGGMDHRSGICRRDFLKRTGAVSAAWMAGGAAGFTETTSRATAEERAGSELRADVVICGAGLGGLAAALAACRAGLSVVLTEETDWIGGQLTSQGVPPDEHRWIEQFGAPRSYRHLRDGIREYYRRHLPITEVARARWNLNPGDGFVSRLCHEPRVALAVLESMLAAYLGGGRLRILHEHRPMGSAVHGDRVEAVTVRSLRTGRDRVLRAPWFVDATELGDLLPMAGVEWVTGAEGKAATGEMHATEKADPRNQQAFTMCFAVDHVAGEEHLIERPREYDFWRDYVPSLTPAWPGRLLSWTYSHPRTLAPRTVGCDPQRDSLDDGTVNLWAYRRIAKAANFQAGAYRGDLSLINWPQNDYLLGDLIFGTDEEKARHMERARQLSLSLLFWMQTEAPRPDGKVGWPGLRLRGDVLGGPDGLAKAPYIRESRRIRALHTIREEECGVAARAAALGKPVAEVRSEAYRDSVGIGHYAIDLHPSTTGDNYVDFEALPFHLPLGALLPERVENLLPANKNIGTTHVTNGAYRLHPVEWGIGEAVGGLLAFCHSRRQLPRAVRENDGWLAEFQTQLRQQGVETRWPSEF